MKRDAIEVTKLSDEQLKNLIDNHRRKLATDSLTYLDALAEQARRSGQGLDFNKSFSIIRRAAAERRFVSYKELADASGADWNRVHYSIGGHLWSLVEYAHRRGWPMLSAIVVNKQNVATGNMECQSASDRDPRSASKRDPLVLRFERLAFAPSELVGVAETGRARVDV